MERAEAAFGPVSVLIACAGGARTGRLMEIPDRDMTACFNVNYFGTLNAVRAVCVPC